MVALGKYAMVAVFVGIVWWIAENRSATDAIVTVAAGFGIAMVSHELRMDHLGRLIDKLFGNDDKY